MEKPGGLPSMGSHSVGHDRHDLAAAAESNSNQDRLTPVKEETNRSVKQNKKPMCMCMCMQSHFSHVQLFATLWTVARQAPLSVGSSRQENWSELPCPPPGDIPDPGIEPASLKPPALAGGFFISSTT